LLVQELERRGYSCSGRVWNDSTVDWGDSRVCIIRSTWDYHLQLEEFLSWIDRVKTSSKVLNSPELIRWNVNKIYLRTLQDKGVPIIPTRWTPRGSAFDISSLFDQWPELVIKPAVGLATFGVRRSNASDEGAQDHLDGLLQNGDVMIQEYMKNVTTYGERALVFFRGVFSHAVSKTPFQKLAVGGEAGEKAATAEPDEIALGEKVIEALPSLPHYARVDIVRDNFNQPVLIELELVEPGLFLAFSEDAPRRFADAILAAD
ncbi:MAG: hypothetical protein K2Z81_20555, partial [Cyanobacteria bacterium]|nr:hypothetical protein [Cyanobacteriota bacterium]